jgi:hypothetical protein
MASIRYEIQIEADVEEVWAIAGEPTILNLWFPGITECVVDGIVRTITLAAGMSMPEEIITNDPIAHRFQYMITSPLFSYHRGTIDAFDLGNHRTLVSYATDAVPNVMALVIGGGSLGALAELKLQVESQSGAAFDAATALQEARKG